MNRYDVTVTSLHTHTQMYLANIEWNTFNINYTLQQMWTTFLIFSRSDSEESSSAGICRPSTLDVISARCCDSCLLLTRTTRTELLPSEIPNLLKASEICLWQIIIRSKGKICIYLQNVNLNIRYYILLAYMSLLLLQRGLRRSLFKTHQQINGRFSAWGITPGDHAFYSSQSGWKTESASIKKKAEKNFLLVTNTSFPVK